MTTSGIALTEEELKLLKAAVAHVNANPSDCHLKIERIQYGFRTNLTEYAEVITDPTDKEKWESSLKCLISHDLLRHVSAGNQSWTYAVTDQGFEAAG